MKDIIQGTFHFHSTYSHDGRSTLPEIASRLKSAGLAFCIMTEHFEDFDAAKFNRYVEETGVVSRDSGFLLIPGIEVNLAGVDTIIFPVQEFEAIARFASEGKDARPAMFKVLAHPSKYAFEAVAKHVEKYEIGGVELWNQQADGMRIPPLEFIAFLKGQPWRNRCVYFFGCDLHDAGLTVANVLFLPGITDRSMESIVTALHTGKFVSRNCPTGAEYCNGPGGTELDQLLESLLKRPYHQGQALRTVRKCLKFGYKRLPRNMQRSLNDLKNFVRNKV